MTQISSSLRDAQRAVLGLVLGQAGEPLAPLRIATAQLFQQGGLPVLLVRVPEPVTITGSNQQRSARAAGRSSACRDLAHKVYSIQYTVHSTQCTHYTHYDTHSALSMVTGG